MKKISRKQLIIMGIIVMVIWPIYWQIGSMTFFPPQNYDVSSIYTITETSSFLITENFLKDHKGFLVTDFDVRGGTPEFQVLGPDDKPIEISEIIFHSGAKNQYSNSKVAWIEFIPPEDGTYMGKISNVPEKPHGQSLYVSYFGHLNPIEKNIMEIFSFSKESNILLVTLVNPLTYFGAFILLLGKSSLEIKSINVFSERSRFKRPHIYITIVIVFIFFFLYIVLLSSVNTFYEGSAHSSEPDEFDFKDIGYTWFGIYFAIVICGFSLAGALELNKFYKTGFNIMMFSLPFVAIIFPISLGILLFNDILESLYFLSPIPLLMYIPLILAWKNKILFKEIS